MVVLFLVIYSGITFYLGWSLKKWLLALSWFRFPIVYWIGFYIVSFSIIIGRIHEALRIFSVIGNYWMYILQYGLILVLCAQFVIWLPSSGCDFQKWLVMYRCGIRIGFCGHCFPLLCEYQGSGKNVARKENF